MYNFDALRHISIMNPTVDHRRAYYLILDTETVIPSEWLEEGEADNLDKSVPYNVGGAIVDRQGNVYATFSVLDDSIFFGRMDLMETCYFADKRPLYLDGLEDGTFTLVRNAWDIRDIINTLYHLYHFRAVIAHNMRFDYRACKNAMQFVGAESARMFPYDADVWDTLAMARSIYGKNKTYKRYCQQNGYMTKNNQLRYTAEILYRYLTNDEGFEEEHTALSDVLIEKEIFAACNRAHKKMRRHYWKEG